MDNHFFLTDDILWDYADDLLLPQEAQQVKAFLKQHPEWQTKLEAIRAEQRALHALPLEKPGPDFADRVMASWTAEQMQSFAATAPPHKRDRTIMAFGVALGALVLAPLIAMIVTVLQSAPVNVDLPHMKIPAIDASQWSGLLLNPVLQIALVGSLAILMLRVIDKYLQVRWRMEAMGG